MRGALGVRVGAQGPARRRDVQTRSGSWSARAVSALQLRAGALLDLSRHL